MASLLDTKAIAKPTVFKGQYNDWQDWSFVFRSYVALLSARMAEVMRLAEASPDLVGMPTDANDLQHAHDLYHILVVTVQSRALMEVRRAPSLNGFEAWRLL